MNAEHAVPLGSLCGQARDLVLTRSVLMLEKRCASDYVGGKSGRI